MEEDDGSPSKIPPAESTSLVHSDEEELSCPFLLNVFYRFNRHNKLHFYQQFFLHTNKSYYNGGAAAAVSTSSSSSSTDAFRGQQMMHIYTWLDISLRELFDLVSGAVLSDNSSSRHSRNDVTPRDFVLNFCSVGLDRNGNYCMRQIGKVSSVAVSADDSKKLRDVKLCVGDYLDVAIHPVRDSAVPADASG